MADGVVWIGTLCAEAGVHPEAWSLHGLYSSREKAFSACGGKLGSGMRTIVPARLDEVGCGDGFRAALMQATVTKLAEAAGAARRAKDAWIEFQRDCQKGDVFGAARMYSERVSEAFFPLASQPDGKGDGALLWIVFSHAAPSASRSSWHIAGVFTSREKAARVCPDGSFLMAPVRIDESGAEKADGFPGAERPGMRTPPEVKPAADQTQHMRTV